MKKFISILLLILFLVPIVMAISVTFGSPVKEPKSIYEDNPWFWVALVATVVAIVVYSYIFYKKIK